MVKPIKQVILASFSRGRNLQQILQPSRPNQVDHIRKAKNILTEIELHTDQVTRPIAILLNPRLVQTLKPQTPTESQQLISYEESKAWKSPITG